MWFWLQLQHISFQVQSASLTFAISVQTEMMPYSQTLSVLADQSHVRWTNHPRHDLMLLSLTWFITIVGCGDLCQLLRGTDTHQNTEACQLLRYLYYNSFFHTKKEMLYTVKKTLSGIKLYCCKSTNAPVSKYIQFDMLKDRPTHIFFCHQISHINTVPKQNPVRML